jgi:hypothetical protein
MTTVTKQRVAYFNGSLVPDSAARICRFLTTQSATVR